MLTNETDSTIGMFCLVINTIFVQDHHRSCNSCTLFVMFRLIYMLLCTVHFDRIDVLLVQINLTCRNKNNDQTNNFNSFLLLTNTIVYRIEVGHLNVLSLFNQINMIRTCRSSMTMITNCCMQVKFIGVYLDYDRIIKYSM
jgi:hypothetical protein